MTEWRPVVGYETHYEVSDEGQIRSVDRVVRNGNRWIKRRGQLRSQSYIPSTKRMRVSLCSNGVRKSWLVQILVAEAFHGPRPPGLECCHNDGDSRNNRADNLRWDTRSSNVLDRVRHGQHPQANKTHCAAGHEYTEANTYRPAPGKRSCRTCAKTYQRRYKQKMRAARQERLAA